MSFIEFQAFYEDWELIEAFYKNCNWQVMLYKYCKATEALKNGTNEWHWHVI